MCLGQLVTIRHKSCDFDNHVAPNKEKQEPRWSKVDSRTCSSTLFFFFAKKMFCKYSINPLENPINRPHIQALSAPGETTCQGPSPGSTQPGTGEVARYGRVPGAGEVVGGFNGQRNRWILVMIICRLMMWAHILTTIGIELFIDKAILRGIEPTVMIHNGDMT